MSDYNPIKAMLDETRAHQLRMQMLSDPSIMEQCLRGAEEAERGEVIDWEELEKRLMEYDEQPTTPPLKVYFVYVVHDQRYHVCRLPDGEGTHKLLTICEMQPMRNHNGKLVTPCCMNSERGWLFENLCVHCFEGLGADLRHPRRQQKRGG